MQGIDGHFPHRMIGEDRDAALAQHAPEAGAHAGVVGGQDRWSLGEQGEAQARRVVAAAR